MGGFPIFPAVFKMKMKRLRCADPLQRRAHTRSESAFLKKRRLALAPQSLFFSTQRPKPFWGDVTATVSGAGHAEQEKIICDGSDAGAGGPRSCGGGESRPLMVFVFLNRSNQTLRRVPRRRQRTVMMMMMMKAGVDSIASASVLWGSDVVLIIIPSAADAAAAAGETTFLFLLIVVILNMECSQFCPMTLDSCVL